jgi:hypothetical protein
MPDRFGEPLEWCDIMGAIDRLYQKKELSDEGHDVIMIFIDIVRKLSEEIQDQPPKTEKNVSNHERIANDLMQMTARQSVKTPLGWAHSDCAVLAQAARILRNEDTPTPDDGRAIGMLSSAEDHEKSDWRDRVRGNVLEAKRQGMEWAGRGSVRGRGRRRSHCRP